MNTSLNSVNRYKGFELESPITFFDYLCLVTGRNGAGKTRLLEGIVNSNIQAIIDDSQVYQNQVTLLNMDIDNRNILVNFSNNNYAQNLSYSVLRIASTVTDTTQLPEICGLNVNHHSGIYEHEEFKVKEIVERAEALLKKKIHDITADELELSILAHKDIINGKANLTQASLSQLTVNYFQTIFKNKWLKFLKSEGQDISYLEEDELYAIMGEENPAIAFNKTLESLFRGKFSISLPIEKNAHFDYNPKLTLNKTNEQIDIKDLSSGEKIIFWLAEKTFEIKYSNPKYIFNNKSIVLIDEPDAHLHPQMTNDLFRCLDQLHNLLRVNFIITTHSPTTVALCPNDSIINLTFSETSSKYLAKIIEKDKAIAELLDGVSQISINPDNNRQVYVENENDYNIYELVYRKIKDHSSRINRFINLTFVSSGEKISENELSKHLRAHINDEDKIKGIVATINGQGNWGNVVGMVESLRKNGNHTVRGLIDWDLKTRRHIEDIKVFAKNKAYSIENIVFDPISIFAYHHRNDIIHEDFTLDDTRYKSWSEILEDDNILQKVIDNIIRRLLGRDNNRDYEISYMNGRTFKSDREFYFKNGHELEVLILKNYVKINELRQNNPYPPIIYQFIRRSTLAFLEWGFINTTFEDAFVELQN
ncbi:AAA family ATPase [Enterobacter cloacae complex sp. SHL012]|uniref:AAA family ATPase n=1 Tax=Enterobacter cloacae complex TaxID=354276 RepID=UPI003754F0B8